MLSFLVSSGLLGMLAKSAMSVFANSLTSMLEQYAMNQKLQQLGWTQAKDSVDVANAAAQKKADDAQVNVALNSRTLGDAINRL